MEKTRFRTYRPALIVFVTLLISYLLLSELMIRAGYGHITYRDRSYSLSNNKPEDADTVQAEQKKLYNSKLVPTGNYFCGRQIYDMEATIHSENVPTIIYLKLLNGQFTACSLSGGP